MNTEEYKYNTIKRKNVKAMWKILHCDWYALYHHSFIPLHLIPPHSIPLLPYTTFTTYDYFIPLHFIPPILFATRTTLYHCTAQLT